MIHIPFTRNTKVFPVKKQVKFKLPDENKRTISILKTIKRKLSK